MKDKTPLATAFDTFVSNITAHDALDLLIPYDEDWPSACYIDTADAYGTMVKWQPIAQTSPLSVFERINTAMDAAIHPDLETFYSQYWAGTFEVASPWGELGILQLWNQEDEEHLRGNLIGHFLQQKRMRLPQAGFIAIDLNDDNQLITLDNASGAIYRENIKKKRRTLIADNCIEFLNALSPLPA